MTNRGPMDEALSPTADPGWVLVEDGYDPLRESSLESRFAVSNGFLGVRGARATTRGAQWVVPARTYVAGLFDCADAPGAVPALAPAADWLKVDFSVDGRPLVQHPGDVSSHRVTLDLRRGALLTEWRPLNATGSGVRLRTSRLVSLADRAVGLQLIQLDIESGEPEFTLEAMFEGLDLGLTPVRLEQDLGVWRTQHSGMGLAMASVACLQLDGAELKPTALDQFKWSWTWKGRPGEIVSFARLVAVTRSGDADIDPGPGARAALTAAQTLGWRGVVAQHEAAWKSRWQASG